MGEIPQLPTELLQRILWSLPVYPRSKESVRVLCNFGTANSRFLVASRLSKIWKEHYEARWIYSDPIRDAERRKKYEPDDFAAMYRIRSELDNKALTLLDAIMDNLDDRESMALVIVELGLDVWDALRTVIESVPFYSSGLMTMAINPPAQNLTRQYWAKELSSLIARSRSIAIWADLCGDIEVSFEKTLAALSAFFGYDVEQITRELDRLADICRQQLQTRNISQNSPIPVVAEEICRWMREYGFTKPSRHLHNALMHNFLHHVLFEGHTALPISLVYVFTCIARRLGYNAHPVAFPHKVLATILPLEEAEERVYVDVYDSSTRAILSYAELPSILENMGLNIEDTASLAQLTKPAKSSLMLLRAVKNILTSLDRFIHVREHTTAHCAAYCAGVLLTRDGQLIQQLYDGSEGPLDRLVTLKHHLRPHLLQGAQDQLDFCLRTDSQSSKKLPKSGGRKNVRYYVGMLFRHKKYEYVGLIKGWDYFCDTSEDWILQMRVDHLPGGRNQPFYNTYALDGRIRYVAEEHIIPLNTVDFVDINVIIKMNANLGRWFDGVELPSSGRARFIQSKESKLMFPDDEAFALKFTDITPKKTK